MRSINAFELCFHHRRAVYSTAVCDLAAPPAGHLGFSTFGGKIPPPSLSCEICWKKVNFQHVWLYQGLVRMWHRLLFGDTFLACMTNFKKWFESGWNWTWQEARPALTNSGCTHPKSVITWESDSNFNTFTEVLVVISNTLIEIHPWSS